MYQEAFLLIALAGVAGGALGAKQSGGIAWKGATAAAIGTAAPIAILAAFGMESIAVALVVTLLAVCVVASALGFAGRQTVAIIAGMVLVGGVASAMLDSIATL